MTSSLTISGIQANLHWEDKQANLRMFEEKVSFISDRTEIVVLPEMFSTGFSMNPKDLAETMDGETVKWMRRLSAQKKVILTGSAIIAQEGANNQNEYLNRLIWMLPNGQAGYYDKRHLFAYGDEDQHYSPGFKRLITSVNGWKLNLLVCYDLRFPVWSRQTPIAKLASDRDNAGLEYDVLIYVANWPEKRIHAWKALLQARAIENQCFVVGVNRTGDDGKGIHYPGSSMVVDPAGEVLYHAADAEDLFTVTLERERLETIRKKFPFWKDADRFKILNDD